jgi:putative ABC transport system ATP-binding protein
LIATRQDHPVAARLDNVAVTYGRGATAVHAVRGVSLEIRRGEVLLLMGPSGSGKSTLLQVLGCIRHATEGEVQINGESVGGLDEEALSRLRCQKIGFVFQHYNLLPSLKAWENVALALELRGLSGPPIEETSRQILARLGLEARADAYPEELSGGQRQRVAIARATVGKPGLILADEPTAALDTASGAEVAQLLASMANEHGHAVVVVTHDARISGIAHRIVSLEDGMVRSIKASLEAQYGTLQESTVHEVENYIRRGAGRYGDRSTAAFG